MFYDDDDDDDTQCYFGYQPFQAIDCSGIETELTTTKKKYTKTQKPHEKVTIT